MKDQVSASSRVLDQYRHLAVDTLGLLLTVLITAASVQDRDAARPLLWNLRKAFPAVKLAWADGGYAGKLVTWAAGKLKPKLKLEIVKRPDDLHTFQVLPGSCPAGGWSSAPWPGSPATGAPSGTTNGCPPTTRPTSTGP